MMFMSDLPSQAPCASASRRPRVLFLSSCVSGGGVGRSLAAYLHYDGDKIEAHVVLPEPGVIAKHLEPHATLHLMPEFVERPLRPPYRAIIAIPLLNLVGGLTALCIAAVKLVRLVHRLRPDVIYANHMLAKPVALVVGAWTRTPVIYHGRNIHDQRLVERLFYQAIARPAIVRRILCNSAATARTYAAVVPEKTVVVPNFVADLNAYDRSAFTTVLRQELGFHASTPVIGFVGRLVRWKGVDVLIRAFARVAAAYPDAQLVILGENDPGRAVDVQGELRALAMDLGMGDRVHFLGFRDDVRPYLADFDIHVVPSTAPEPFGRVVIEGLMLGVPTIVSAHGGAIEIVRDGCDGLWFRPGDDADLARCLTALLDDPDRRRALAATGAAHVRATFDGATIAARITELIRAEVR